MSRLHPLWPQQLDARHVDKAEPFLHVYPPLTNTPKAMLTANVRITLASVALSMGIFSTAYSAESEFVSGRVAQEIRAGFSGKRLRATRTVTMEKAGEKIAGQVKVEMTADGKIASIAVSTNLVTAGVDPDALNRRREAQEYLNCATRNGCAGENSNARIAACYAACAAAIIVP